MAGHDPLIDCRHGIACASVPAVVGMVTLHEKTEHEHSQGKKIMLDSAIHARDGPAHKFGGCEFWPSDVTTENLPCLWITDLEGVNINPSDESRIRTQHVGFVDVPDNGSILVDAVNHLYDVAGRSVEVPIIKVSADTLSGHGIVEINNRVHPADSRHKEADEAPSFVISGEGLGRPRQRMEAAGSHGVSIRVFD